MKQPSLVTFGKKDKKKHQKNDQNNQILRILGISRQNLRRKVTLSI